jgi:hypothetical protein
MYPSVRPFVCLSIYLWFYSPFVGLWQLFQFLDPIRVFSRRSSWTGDQPVGRPLPMHRTTQTQNKRTHTFIPLSGVEAKIPAFERVKTIHVTDRAATVIGKYSQIFAQNYITA